MTIDDANIETRATIDFTVDTMSRANCSRLYRMRDTLEMDPIYQRQGNIWSRSNKQLFIDSLLNGVDIPKIYFHDGAGVAPGKKYAIIDGKQRLESLFEFYDDVFPLSERFEMFNTAEIQSLGLSSADLERLAGKFYSQIDREYPQVARVLDGCPLSVMIVATDDLEAIEEMFSRLNDAVPLNAAEKRQAMGEPMRSIVRRVAETQLFAVTLPFSNRRYRHLDVAAKFIKWSLSALESQEWDQMSGVRLDVKRAQLDRLFDLARMEPGNHKWDDAEQLAVASANALSERYRAGDPLLSSVGTLSVLFLDQLRAQRFGGTWTALSREAVIDFEAFRRRRDNLEPEDPGDIVGALTIAEYNRLTQSPNDGSALRVRLDIVDVYSAALGAAAPPLRALSEAELIE